MQSSFIDCQEKGAASFPIDGGGKPIAVHACSTNEVVLGRRMLSCINNQLVHYQLAISQADKQAICSTWYRRQDKASQVIDQCRCEWCVGMIVLRSAIKLHLFFL